MISLRNILTISKYESRVLWRNWFFRIFALAALFFLTIFNIAGFSPVGDNRWWMISNAWGIPYASMIILSIGQSAAVIFLATGLIKKDKKLDTNEVFMVRAISNTDHVFGKALALLKLFLTLNIVILCIGLTINIINPDARFNPLAYLIYPLLTSVPSIIFVTGLAFLLVTVLRNQPISIVLLVGMSGIILIYFFDKYSNIFDYMAFRFSLMASDMVGFNNVKMIIMQRSFYLVAGITCLFATSLFLQRLHNSRKNRIVTIILTLLLVAGSSFIMRNLWKAHINTINFRKNLIAINDKWIDILNIDIESNAIEMEHFDGKIKASSRLQVRNSNSEPINQIYFTLNPGLEIEEVVLNGSPIEFSRELQIISFTIERGLKVGEPAAIIIKYKGIILDDVAHLDVDQKRYDRIQDYFVYSVHKQFAFLSKDYALFTKDVLWYPDTQIGFSRKSPVKERKSFINFELDVKVTGNNVAVSQGILQKTAEGHFQFRPEYPLPQISLAIGSYETKELEVDSIRYIIYHFPGNDFFMKNFNQLQDTLSLLITDLVNEYEFDQQIKYPFPRLQFVEVPVQFSAFDKIYEGHQAYVQPEMILYPEEGGSVRAFDFIRQMENMDEQAREENLVLSEKEKQANVFKDMVKRVFTKQISDQYFYDGRESDDPNYSLFANLYAYNSGITSTEWPLFNKSIAHYLNNESPAINDYSRNINGTSFTEECNAMMREATIMEILTEETDYNKIQKSVSLKGDYLFSLMSQLIGEKTFKDFVYDWIGKHPHSLTSFSDFSAEIKKEFELDINPIIRQVYFTTDQPSFEISNTREVELLDGDRTRYQILFDITNTAQVDGIVKINFRYWEENEIPFYGEQVESEDDDLEGYYSVIKKKQSKQFGFLLDNPPDMISINTLISQNIPSIVGINPGKFNRQENYTPFVGDRIVDFVTSSAQYEVIVDNEDSGFSTFSPIKETYLQQFLESRYPKNQKYYGSWRRSYSKWLATTGSGFYGNYIRSAHFTRSGKGDKITKWEPDLSESGFYDLYVYMIGKNQNQYLGRDNDRKYSYEYVINHRDGTDEISFGLSNAERGWNFLGSYYFRKGEGNVILTDKCDMSTVYADAVRWVRQQ
jgi:hypothetical protein